jgi:hypothetical protein
MAAPNILNVATLTGKTAGLAVTTSAADLVTNPAASGKVFKINSLVIANINGVASADITVTVSKAGLEYYLAYTIAVPNDASVILISKDSGIYLEENDKIRVLASANSYLHAVCSYEEIS